MLVMTRRKRYANPLLLGKYISTTSMEKSVEIPQRTENRSTIQPKEMKRDEISICELFAPHAY